MTVLLIFIFLVTKNVATQLEGWEDKEMDEAVEALTVLSGITSK